jgi:hypothetical protein
VIVDAWEAVITFTYSMLSFGNYSYSFQNVPFSMVPECNNGHVVQTTGTGVSPTFTSGQSIPAATHNGKSGAPGTKELVVGKRYDILIVSILLGVVLYVYP